MNRDLRQVVEERKVDNLIANTFDVDVFSVVIRKTTAETFLPKGAVLALSESDDKYVLLGTTAGSNEILTANAILAEDITTSKTEDITATAYRKGHFNRNALTVTEGYTMDNGDREKLRKAGIYLESSI